MPKAAVQVEAGRKEEKVVQELFIVVSVELWFLEIKQKRLQAG